VLKKSLALVVVDFQSYSHHQSSAITQCFSTLPGQYKKAVL